MKLLLSASLLALMVPLLGGCQSLSFAPPELSALKPPPKDLTPQEEIDDIKLSDAEREEASRLRALAARLPRFPLSSVTTVSKAVDWITSRKKDYDDAADNLANAPQAFDLPLIGAGLTAVNAAALGGKEKTAKQAGVFATGLVATRSYYQFAPRHEALIAASKSLSCLRRVARTVVGIDGQEERWKQGYAWATSTGQASDVGAQIRRLTPIVMNARDSLVTAVDDIDSAARSRLAKATAPDLTTFAATYQRQLVALQTSTEQNDEAQDLVNDRKKASAANLLDGELTHISLLSDRTFLDALTALESQITTCRVLAG